MAKSAKIAKKKNTPTAATAEMMAAAIVMATADGNVVTATLAGPPNGAAVITATITGPAGPNSTTVTMTLVPGTTAQFQATVSGPGTYTVTITADGTSSSTTVVVGEDPAVVSSSLTLPENATFSVHHVKGKTVVTIHTAKPKA